MSTEGRTVSRRRFASLSLLGATLAPLGGCEGNREISPKRLLLPPKSARVQTTACAYCIVGCGYKAYSWPVDEVPGGPAAEENALGVDFPLGKRADSWVSPQMHSVVNIDGKRHHLVVVPDPDATVVNPGGNHSLGGSLAKKLYSADEPQDRLVVPQLRVEGELVPITWEEAIAIIARVSLGVLDAAGVTAWGMKTYSYQFYENTYAITKLALVAINTPCWAPHDKPAEASDVPGLTDAGVDPFSAAYQDWHDADVLFVSGVGLYDAHGVLFSSWVQGGPKLIVVNPRRDTTAAYAEANGGLFLQVRPGTDTLLHNAIAWVILTEGWEDSEFIAQFCADDDSVQATSAEFDINNPIASSQVFNSTEAGAATLSYLKTNAALRWRRIAFGLSSQEYREFILGDVRHEPERAAEVIGVTAEQVRLAAELLAKPLKGKRVKASFMLEKGNYWGHNYPNTASFVSLGLLSGAGTRPGQVISRAGGHQRGMMSAGSYPYGRSPQEIDGNKVALNLDHWTMEGKLRFAWVIGTTWAGGGTAAAGALYESLRAQTVAESLPQLSMDSSLPDGPGGPVNVDYVVDTLLERGAAGGLALVQQDIYPQALTELADLVLPAAGWGEAPFSRMQGERRLRHYPKLCDPPKEAKPDWWIVAKVARAMGFSGFSWSDQNELFEAAGEASRGGISDYWPLVRMAGDMGKSATELLESLGTEGIQCPIKKEGERLVGTVRLHESGFATPTGKALFVRGSWDDVLPRQEQLSPKGSELWVLNRRAPGTWNSMTEDYRNPYRLNLWPENFIEVHPSDADRLGLRNGINVTVHNDDVLDPELATRLPEQTKGGGYSAVVQITDRVVAGTSYVHFNFLGEPGVAANCAVSNTPDPINGMYSFKLAKGTIEPA